MFMVNQHKVTNDQRIRPGSLPRFVSTKDLQILLGLTASRLSQLKINDGFATVSTGVWDLKAALQAYLTSIEPRNKGLRYDYECRLKAAQADKAKIELAQLREKIISLNEIRAAVSVAVLVTRHAFREIAPKCTRIISPGMKKRDIQFTIEQEILAVLENLDAALHQSVSLVDDCGRNSTKPTAVRSTLKLSGLR